MNALDEEGVEEIRQLLLKYRQLGDVFSLQAIIGRILKYYVMRYLK